MFEEHVTMDGAPVSGALWDALLFLFANGHRLQSSDCNGPFFYIPKVGVLPLTCVAVGNDPSKHSWRTKRKPVGGTMSSSTSRCDLALCHYRSSALF